MLQAVNFIYNCIITASIFFQSAKITKDLFKNFARAGGAVFVSTHTLNYAQDLCTKIGVINKGKLIAEGNLTQLRKRIKNSRADLENLYLELTK